MEKLDGYISALREHCARLPDKRTGSNATYRMEDIGLAAFSVFLMQSPSFLAHQKALEEMRGTSNAQTLFGMTKIPGDNHIRQTLDGTPTDHFDGLFAHIVKDLDDSGHLKSLCRLGGRILIALDGSEHFASRKVHCPHCSTRKRSDGETEYFHSFVGATIVASGQATVLPLPAEFVRPQDGTKKQDCESVAARRGLSRLGPQFAWLQPVYLGDDLSANQPMCQAIQAIDGSFILTSKPSSHKTLAEYVNGVDLDSLSKTEGVGSAKRIYRYRWMEGVPIRDGKDALIVNWLEIEIAKPNGKVTYRSSFVTDLALNRQTVADIAACGRARWKIENESFNVLKNNGYNLEHNFGHGKDTLASILVVLNLLAFAMHNACDLAEGLWQDGRQKVGARIRLFEHIRSISVYLVFPSWTSLMRTIRTGRPPRQPPDG